MAVNIKRPAPVRPDHYDSRICFAIAFFRSESDADKYAEWVRECGFTYNGGFYHGRPCGRDKSWDYTDDDGNAFFAVTE